MPLSDTEILESIRSGGKHHYARIIERYKDKAFTLAVRILRNREEAEEAVQDAFIRAYNALEKFEARSKFGTWFYRIVYNVCISRLGTRDEGIESVEYDDEAEYENVALAENNSSVIDLEKNDLIALVKKTMDTLPPKYGSILSLFYFQELSHEEICAVTQLPLGTVKVRLFRARMLLQERIQEELRMEKVML